MTEEQEMGMEEDRAPSHKSYATSTYTYSYRGAKPTHINAPTILTQTHAHQDSSSERTRHKERQKAVYFVIASLEFCAIL